MVFQRIIVVPRHFLERVELDEDYDIISISNPPPDGVPADIPNRPGLKRVHRIEFHDVERNRDSFIALAEAQADELVQYVRESKAGCLVVHCDAGASRSPSVAMAICDWQGGDRSAIEWAGSRFLLVAPPNLHVYRTILYAFERMGGMNVTGDQSRSNVDFGQREQG